MGDRPWKHIETDLQRLGEECATHGSVTPPIFQTSTFVFEDLDTFEGALDDYDTPSCLYTRLNNPTTRIACKKIAALENAEACVLVGSGMAAVTSAVLSCIKSGDHIVSVESAYPPTQRFFNEYLERFNIEVTWVDGRDTSAIENAIRPNTSVIYLESPSSVLFRLQDLAAIAALAKARGITTICDNSYSAGLNQKPLEMGVDLVVHSVTKYIAGHSDVVAGAVCGSQPRVKAILHGEAELLGQSMAPLNAWLITRGMRTLPLRLEQSERAARKVNDFLKQHPLIEEVFYCGDAEFPQADLYQRQMKGTGGLISFVPVKPGRDAAKDFLERLRVFRMGVSFGGFESLATWRESQPTDWAEPRSVVRLYCGLEHPDDLIADLDQAFKAFC